MLFGFHMYTELTETAKNTFDDGPVDMDTAASDKDRTKKGETTFKGRLSVFKSRKTKQYSYAPLPKKTATKGKRNLTPETFEEIWPHYDKTMHDGAIHMSDGSPAFVKAAKKKNLPAATVAHWKQEYVATVAIQKSKMTPKAKAKIQKRPAMHSKTKLYCQTDYTICPTLISIPQALISHPCSSSAPQILCASPHWLDPIPRLAITRQRECGARCRKPGPDSTRRAGGRARAL